MAPTTRRLAFSTILFFWLVFATSHVVVRAQEDASSICPNFTYCTSKQQQHQEQQQRQAESRTFGLHFRRRHRHRRLRARTHSSVVAQTTINTTNNHNARVAVCVVAADSDGDILMTVCLQESTWDQVIVNYTFYSCGCCPDDDDCHDTSASDNYSDAPSLTPPLLPWSLPLVVGEDASCVRLNQLVLEWRDNNNAANTNTSYLDILSNQPHYSPGDVVMFQDHLLRSLLSARENATTTGWATGRCVVLQNPVESTTTLTAPNEYCDVKMTFENQGTLHLAGVLSRLMVVLQGTGCFVNATGWTAQLLPTTTLKNESSLSSLAFWQFNEPTPTIRGTSANLTSASIAVNNKTKSTANNTTLGNDDDDDDDVCAGLRYPDPSLDKDDTPIIAWFHSIADQRIDWDGNGATAGDLFVFDQDVVQTANNRKNGIVEGECMFLQTAHANKLYCSMTFFMQNDSNNGNHHHDTRSLLVVEGPFESMIILSGTGCFQYASGRVVGSYPSSPLARYTISFDIDGSSLWWDTTNTSCVEVTGIFGSTWTMPAGRTFVDYGQDGLTSAGDVHVFDNVSIMIPVLNQMALHGTVSGRCFDLSEDGDDEYCTYLLRLPGGMIAIRGIPSQSLLIVASSGNTLCFCGVLPYHLGFHSYH